MVAFNPDVPKDQQSQYWHWSKPIEQPKFSAGVPSSTTGEVLKGIGELGADAIKGADEIVKNFATDEAKDASRDIRSQRIAELNSAYDAVSGGKETLLPKEDSQPYKQSMKGVGDLATARANGKFSETDYWARLDSKLSDIRSRYPLAYREDIDRASASVTGHDAANALLASRLGDINAAMASQQAEAKQMMNRLQKANDDGVPGAAEWVKGFREGRYTPDQLNNKINRAYSIFYDAKKSEAELGKYKADHGLYETKALDYFDKVTTNAATEFFNNRNDAAGITDKVAKGIQLSEVEAQQLAEHTAQLKSRYMQEGIRMANEPMSDGKSLAQKVGMKPLMDKLADNAKIFDLQMDPLINKDYGAIHSAANYVTRSQEDSAKKFWNLPIGQQATKLQWLKNNVSEQAYQVANGWYNSHGQPEDILQIMQMDQVKRLTATPDEPHTLTDSVKGLQKQGIKDPKPVQQIIENVFGDKGLLNPKATPVEVKANIAASFDPSNEQFLGYFSKESQMPVFKAMTSKPITDKIFATGSRDDIKKYQNWSEVSYKLLLGNEMKSLETIQNLDKSIKPYWNNETHQWGLSVDGDTKALDTNKEYYTKSEFGSNPKYPMGTLDKIRTSLRRLNDGMANMSHIAESAKTDVDVYLLRTFQELGVNLDPEKIGNLPEAIARPIITSREQSKENQKKFQDLSGESK